MNLNQITVPVKDVSASIAFYERLGLKLIVSALPEYARFQCPEVDSTFSLHRVDVLPEGDGIWIYFEIEQLDVHVQQLLDMGFVFDEMPQDKPWLWREARLKDPDQNQLIFYYAGKNRVDPPWKLRH